VPVNHLTKRIGLGEESSPYPDPKLIQFINLKLAALGEPAVPVGGASEFDDMAVSFLSHHRETKRLLADYLCPADQRIQDFLNAHLAGTGCCPVLPGQTFILDRHGLARALSLPPDQDEFSSDIVKTYRLRQGVLHNPKSDRRTTKGTFHVAEGGLPIPADKTAVPKAVFARLLEHALRPPEELLRLPFTAGLKEPARCFVTLLLRPVVCPEVPGFIEEKSLEVRFFVPGNLVGNLDFVESIFGNAGDPYLPENDAGLDVEHWTGHSGCVILAPHLVTVTKKEVGLPHWDEATERQRSQGQCWKDAGELYNDGGAFKLTCRDERGVIVTLIADNYFGYCKKEVKTQIGYSANLFGLCEEEHAGGAVVYASYDLGEAFSGHLHVKRLGHTFAEVKELYGDCMDLQPEGHGVDKQYSDILYVPEDVHFDLHKQTVSWPSSEGDRSIKLLPGRTYVRPSGYKVEMVKPRGTRQWRLIGTVAEPVVCHKPCTVSGGGKSEISKPITDAIIQGPVFVAHFQKDFDQVAELLAHDYTDRYQDKSRQDARPILSPERSLGSVIKLLTPARRMYTQEYNDWLLGIPQHIKELVFVVKRFYKPGWGDDWRRHFSVDIVNGIPGNELKCDGRRLVTNYLRVGFMPDGSWRTFGLRKDFHPSTKFSLEDDITASVVVPTRALAELNPDTRNQAVKFVRNCEYRFFQRPDDAIHRGYDKQTEADLAGPGNFISNFEPLTTADARALVEDTIGFHQFTRPMRRLIRDAASGAPPKYFVSSAHPRIVDGRPTKNPRYLQLRPDLLQPRELHLAEMATRMFRRLPAGSPVLNPVTAVLPGRRNNPPDVKNHIRPLACFNPIHYFELPELFMEFISSMTGKSPSTTGAGSEGAMTKGPFNALPGIIDLNAALVSFLLTGYDAFVTAAAWVGPVGRVDHDISLLIPEIWSRMTAEEQDAKFLIDNGHLEKCEDLEFEGRKVLASRLGHRITRRFVRNYFGRVFNHPMAVITDELLQPELQNLAVFVESVDNIVATHKRVALQYFEDGTVAQACPPLFALLHLMAHGEHEGKGLDHPEIRAMFTREYLLASDWYARRLEAKREREMQLWERHACYLEHFLARTTYAGEARRLGVAARLEKARQRIAEVRSPEYVKSLKGTLGVEPL
jgi:phosphoenolpyruvate carboxykinase (diphosphate)